ncbi:catalase HPII [Pedobacter psychrophilus]|uniref:Catalase n=1 Tax=Pedobacter psychrophilus TaxID=1826909 RepID=A0A179DB01_9SPHI|nr:catalase [Pedobacter psychrophilus]OAQ38225.1 catalase HPII [Pedobacter psychrophilus]
MKNSKPTEKNDQNQKFDDLSKNTEDGSNQFMTTNQGVKINDDNNSLKSGERGSTLLEDFILREKITHFDHERIPERIVHARGVGAHGVFKVYDDSMKEFTKAKFLTDPSLETPIFARFSTVAGSRGSADLARDVRGFAVKFYTEEGNYDFVGNNMPVFFIQDAIKFPDLIHAVKPEPHNEIPQAASAHDTFWDFISLSPESMHMIMWAMSDRAIPRSLRMMEGFNVHTYRFINEAGKSCFVKMHWKPLLGMHSVVWDEALKINGQDPDFHRRDLHDAIENGDFAEWEFGVQIIPEEDEHKFDFDLLDPTKLVPEELVPVKKIGKMTLNRNTDNYFAETEQVAFHLGHVVPGIDFTNDPLLQGRLFSYTDTQLSRLGGPNFHEIPINRPIAPMHNNQRDGIARMEINKSKTAYFPNSISDGSPKQAKATEGGFTSYQERVDSYKIRTRSKSFLDFFSQATLFYNSQSEPEQSHIQDALKFELGKLERPEIAERVVGLLTQIDKNLAAVVAKGLGIEVPEPKEPMNHQFGADENPDDFQPIDVNPEFKNSPALSMANTVKDTIKTRQVAFLAADGVDAESLSSMKKSLQDEGAVVKVIAPHGGYINDSNGNKIKVDKSFLAFASVLVDAIYIPSGEKSIQALMGVPDAIHFINETFTHCKALAFCGDAKKLFDKSYVAQKLTDKKAIDKDEALIMMDNVTKEDTQKFITAIANHRFWPREKGEKVPS